MYWKANLTGKRGPVRGRSIALGLSALLIAYLVACASSPALADSGTTEGTVDVSADSLDAIPGSLVTYTVTVNNGSQAGLVTVFVNLPSHTSLVSAPDCTARTGSGVACTFAMFPFDTATTQVTVQIDENINCNSQLRNAAHVHGWGPASLDLQVTCPTP